MTMRMRLGSWLVAAASVHRGLALRGERWALRSDETEADGACTEATLLSRARFATSPTVTRCESDSVAVVTLLVNWSLKKLLLGTR